MTKYIPLVMFGLLLASCGNKKPSGQAAQRALPYPVVQIPVKDITGKTTYPVSIEGIVTSEVRSKIPGYITGVYVDEGDKVHKGQLLFRLETQSLTEDAQAAKANVQAVEVSINQLKPLVEKDIVSKSQLETANAKLAQAKAAYKSIVANMDYALIRSPINGFISSIPYRTGSLVNPSSPQPLTTVSQTNEVYAYFAMNEVDYLNFIQNTPGKTLEEKIKHFLPVKFQMANGEIYPKEGHITAVTAQVDPNTGTVRFRATFPNPNHLIANGSSGKIFIPTPFKNATLVPKVSTYEQQGKTYVYQVLKDSTVTAKVLEVKGEVNNLYVVESGIRGGDKIIAKGAGKLHEKEKIIPEPMTIDSLQSDLSPIFQ